MIQANLGAITANTGISFLRLQYETLKSMERSKIVDDAGGLIDALANDLVNQGKFADSASAMPTATSQITLNKTTALTTSDDFYVALKDGDPFDELHELMHICSAPGGMSTLQQSCNSLNEGAINLFSEEVSKAAGVKVVTRYAAETKFARDLQTLLDKGLGAGNGIKHLFPFTFKTGGNTQAFFKAVGEAYKGMLSAKSKKGKLNFTQNKLMEQTADAVGETFKTKVLAFNAGWLKNQLVAAQ